MDKQTIVSGKYCDAIIFSNSVEDEAMSDVQKLVDNKISIDSNIRIMPDIHSGYSVPIGTTMIVKDKIVPYFIGVDIGCGMFVQKLSDYNIDIERLDKLIYRYVPAGFSIRNKEHRFAKDTRIDELKIKDELKSFHKHYLAIGTLGGGNHFIELSKDSNEDIYLIIHSGSRNLGKLVADWYQNKAYEQRLAEFSSKKIKTIEELRLSGNQNMIASIIDDMKKNSVNISKDMAYCDGVLFENYIHDMKIMQEYASVNRKAIADIISCGTRWDIEYEFETIHNYIDMETMILRKGAVRANLGEVLIIPMNMSYGSLLCNGKGNPEWNYSANHGAGRIMSRKKAKQTISLSDYQNSMEDVYSSCVSIETIDESPMAYKDANNLIPLMQDTLDIIDILKPIYNFKSK